MSVTGSGSERPRRTLVLVIGMHRSGTSTVAGALGVLGATMPAKGLGLSDDNPKGHFEPKEIVALHDRVLASAGMHWWDWDRFPDAWYDSPAAQEFIDELVDIVRAEFGDAPVFVVKDPRTCKLMPLWRRVAAILDLDAVAVLPFRHPDEVARSLHARDGFPLPNTLMTWLRYVLEAERESRGMRRVFLRYEDLLADGRSVMRRVVETLQLPLPRLSEADLAALDRFIDPDLRRSRAGSGSIDHLHPWLQDAVTSYVRELTPAHEGAGQQPVSVVLDQTHAAFATACAAFVPALHATNKGFEDAQGRNMLIPGLQAERDAAQDLARSANAKWAEAEARIAALLIEGAEVAELRAALQAKNDQIGRLESAIQQAKSKDAPPRRWWQRN
ncbi:sulfotransferase family protein [Methylobacterium sp. Leaf100]|uniref:sulfotransferase family protein n=1 Tax=Methylobacterium sp. Leaf100 TaxID=1736252 RepID=UPI0006F383F0|nr:sulfotransferase family protein [Methylobacterium sp. Leaf100]KQP35025.1 hypothetical protein ASF25_14310 [Methylobacterium sp. Leaf100]